MLDEKGVRELVARKVQNAGSQTVVAKELGITPAYLHDFLAGRRQPGKSILQALGLVKVVTYSFKGVGRRLEPIRGPRP